LEPLYRFGGYGILIDFVKEGLGVGFINKNHVSNELKNGTLFEIKTNLIIPEREIGIAINKKSSNNKLINTFIEYLKQNSK
jgi:DNA-binding transcriptional LysR family regulator